MEGYTKYRKVRWHTQGGQSVSLNTQGNPRKHQDAQICIY